MSFWTGIGLAALFAGGYVASIYTWPKVKEIINGAEAEYAKLKTDLDKLRTKF